MAKLVADYVLERLREWGVHRLFGYPGDGINGFLGALDRADGVGAGELPVPACHEGCHLLVARLDELGIPVRAVERAEEAVDPVAGIPVDAMDAPLAQAPENEV